MKETCKWREITLPAIPLYASNANSNGFNIQKTDRIPVPVPSPNYKKNIDYLALAWNPSHLLLGSM